MPSRRRKNIKPPPSLSFVTLDFGAHGVNWLKVHSGAVRRHAAYWGGPERHQRRGEGERGQRGRTAYVSGTDKDLDLHNDAKPTFDGSPAPSVRRRGSTKEADVRASTISLDSSHEPPCHNEFGDLQHLPSLPFEIRSTGSSFEADLSTFEFVGEDFVKQFLMVDEKEYSLMFSGYALLNYAYRMAFTGHGTKWALLHLKGQLIRHINDYIKLCDGLLSPRCLTAILALGAPVVCLVSQDLPNGRSVLDYIFGSRQGEYLCCLPESADAGQRALSEQIFHQQPMRKLLSTSSASFSDPDSIALLQYLSNHMNMQVPLKPLF